MRGSQDCRTRLEVLRDSDSNILVRATVRADDARGIGPGVEDVAEHPRRVYVVACPGWSSADAAQEPDCYRDVA